LVHNNQAAGCSRRAAGEVEQGYGRPADREAALGLDVLRNQASRSVQPRVGAAKGPVPLQDLHDVRVMARKVLVELAFASLSN